MKNAWKVAVCGIAVTGALSWAACSSTPTSSKLLGKVAQETFASPVTKVRVLADGATRTTVAVAADGSFELVLDKGKTYQVTLQGGEEETPLVFAGAHGKYVTRIAVPSGGAEANLGLVRFFDNSGGMIARSNVTGPEGDGECVDGFFEGTSEPCIGGDAESICADDDDSDSDSDSDGDSDDDDDGDDDGSDGEDVGDQDDDDGEDVEGPVAVPLSGITTLGCDDDDSDSDSDSDGDDDD